MVVALGPGKFYGSSLPRPRIYTDIKYSSTRVDPPVPVLDPLMSWAEEAHWSMGGLSFQRHRLQGRIEGNVEKLRNQIEKSIEKKAVSPPMSKLRKSISKLMKVSSKKEKTKKVADRNRSPSPPPAPMANKRRRLYLGLVDEEDGEEREAVRKWPVRKLSEDFDRVATAKKSPAKSGSEAATVATRTRSRKMVREEPVKVVLKERKRLKKIGEGENGGSSPPSVTRSSPRLAK